MILPVFSQITLQAPLMVVPFRQFRQIWALQPYFPRNPKAFVSRKAPIGSSEELRRTAGWHRLWL